MTSEKHAFRKKSSKMLATMMVFLSIAALGIGFFAVVTMAQTPTFRDVPASHFAFDAVEWVSDPANGAFMVGDARNNFQPSRNMNKFEAAQIFALAAGFRHNPQSLPADEQEVFARSMEQWRAFLNALSAQYASWNRTVDREIAFLLYRGVLAPDEVQNFVTRTGTTEQRQMLTREQAVVWIVRLMGHSGYAEEFELPAEEPFNDDAAISDAFRGYVYHARELEIIPAAGGYFNPQAHFSRADLAVLFFNALADEEEKIVSEGEPVTISGTITSVFRDTHATIEYAAGVRTFPFAPNAIVMIDNIQRTPPFLRGGMATMAIVDGYGRIISIAARSEEETIERERTIRGVIVDAIPPENPGEYPILIIEESDGRISRLRALVGTEFSRAYYGEDDFESSLRWDEIRAGDTIIAELEYDGIARLHAVGTRGTAVGRLTQIRITEHNHEITITTDDGEVLSLIMRPHVFYVHNLRIGMRLRLELNSREAIAVWNEVEI